MIEERVFKVFVEIFEIPKDQNKAELVYNEYPKWDSLGHMGLVAGLEAEFDCMLDMEEILDMSSFEIAVKTMEGHSQ